MSEIFNNKLTVSGNLTDILEFIAKVENTTLGVFNALDFSKIIPFDDRVEPFLKDGDLRSVSIWESVNWGSYSNAIQPTRYMKGDMDEAIVEFDFGTTAPVIPVVTEMGNQFKSLNFSYVWYTSTYDESGCLEIVNGITVKNDVSDFGVYNTTL